ncbi:hypothetical protein L7F22_034014 [Adiantum nelumboides]|nr:hypothetical protein [Adiantum nelumboides]
MFGGLASLAQGFGLALGGLVHLPQGWQPGDDEEYSREEEDNREENSELDDNNDSDVEVSSLFLEEDKGHRQATLCLMQNEETFGPYEKKIEGLMKPRVQPNVKHELIQKFMMSPNLTTHEKEIRRAVDNPCNLVSSTVLQSPGKRLGFSIVHLNHFMFLRSERQINNQNQGHADLDSNISTEASVNQKLNLPLETIAEDSFLDSSLELSYFEMASSNTKVNFDLGPSNKGESLDRNPEQQLLFLKFQFVNELGAKIYKDGMERYCVKVENRRGDMRDLVPVIYSGDRYFDDQGFLYVVVLNPSIVDKWGMTGTKEKVDVELEEAPPALDKPNLKLRRINDMTRVDRDNIFLGLYKYDGGEHATYYRCEEPLLKKLIDEKKLYVFTYGDDMKTELIMTDKYGRSYVNVGPKELAGYIYFGGSLPNYYFTPPRPEPVVRQLESMGYPVFPNKKPVFSESRSVESLGRTAHLGSETYSRDAHAREAMSHRERETDARSSMRAPVESHSRGMDRRGDMSERTRMWTDTRRMRPS